MDDEGQKQPKQPVSSDHKLGQAHASLRPPKGFDQSHAIPVEDSDENNDDCQTEVLTDDAKNDPDYVQSSGDGASVGKPKTGRKKKPKHEDRSPQKHASVFEKFEREYASFKTRVDKDLEKGREAKEEVDQLKSHVKELKKDILGFQKTISELERKNWENQSAFDSALQEKAKQFALAQKDMLEKVEKSTYPSLPDNIIKDKFSELMQSCYGFLKEWFSDSPSQAALNTHECTRVATRECTCKWTI